MYSTNPDTEKETAPGVTTFRVSSKDRTFVDELQYKGWRVRLGDFVHVSNPDDTSRPIMGQVFRCFVSDEA
jgi:chromatin structure-remodeling complex subunit RSC1/2